MAAPVMMNWTVVDGDDSLTGGPGADELTGGEDSPTVGDTADLTARLNGRGCDGAASCFPGYGW